MIEITNADRAGWAMRAVSDFVAATGVDTASSAINDLICNLLHLARCRGFSPEMVCENAIAMMREETVSDSEGEMKHVLAAFRRCLTED